MACGRFGFLVRLIDLMAVVQNAAGKSNLPHACALADGDVVVMILLTLMPTNVDASLS